MNIDDLTLKQIREIAALAPCAKKRVKSHSIPVGEAVLIRTVTHYYTGRIKSVTASDLVLEEAAWIADTGRYSEALTTGKLGEVEPIPTWVILGRGAIIDIVPWKFSLPATVK
jgi:hypothetical protein